MSPIGRLRQGVLAQQRLAIDEVFEARDLIEAHADPLMGEIERLGWVAGDLSRFGARAFFLQVVCTKALRTSGEPDELSGPGGDCHRGILGTGKEITVDMGKHARG